ncbi:AraC family transcriptional regulator [Caballeronia calidae]|uniref:AraC family transcriptional regulator n=1 Tax=Caballeronia calidae TaxID=1777139 RepID=A0A158E4R3_9BURK|nr:helix-turn-helix domain-containing protein [Caballeronia calidae]SAL01839.1 AraC family transcriptional regulator [Caballeronia calidae]
MIEEFDTSVVQSSRRLTCYHEFLSRFYCDVDRPFFADSSDRFHARVTQKPIGLLGVGDIAASGLQYIRTPAALSRNPSDDILASLLVEGRASFEQNGRQTSQDAGDILLCDTAKAYKYNFSTDYRIILLKIPRKQMLCRLPDVENLTAMALDGNSAMGSLAGTVIWGAANVNADLEPCAASKLASSVIDMLAASIETEFHGVKSLLNRHEDVLHRAKKHIEANLGDPELDVDKLSNAIGVSRRTLNRVFASHGTTAVRWLWQKRLEASHVWILEGRSKRIADVAIACGFSDLSHFSRVFKKTYGVAPHVLVKQQA